MTTNELINLGFELYTTVFTREFYQKHEFIVVHEDEHFYNGAQTKEYNNISEIEQDYNNWKSNKINNLAREINNLQNELKMLQYD